MVWDATMWTLWQENLAVMRQRSAPVWDDSAWFAWQSSGDSEDAAYIQRGREITKKFFPAIARWLGNGDCPCTEAGNQAPLPSPFLEQILAATAARVPLGAMMVRPQAAFTAVPGKAATSTFAPSQTPAPSGPETIGFNAPPVNIFMRFKDGMGEYRLDIWDGKGRLIKTVFQREIMKNSETWTSWDGTDVQGRLMPFGDYSVVFSKDGRFLRKIILTWISPNPR